MRTELPKLSPVECRRRAEERAQPDADGWAASRVPEATMWALLAIAGELAELRRELRQRR